MVLLPLALHEPAEQLRAKYGDVMTTREVADHLRISEFTVRRIADSGCLARATRAGPAFGMPWSMWPNTNARSRKAPALLLLRE